jgi:chemotaxis protein histidine kinase CheA
LKLKTGEVSLVDSPANEVEFLVTKNLEENVMGEQQGTVGTDAERVEVEQSGNESEVANVLKHVNAIVENIANVVKAQAPQASAPAIAAATGTPAAGDDDEEDGEESVEKSISAALKAAGIEPTEEQMKKMKAAGFDPSQKFPTAKKPMEKTKKAAAPAAAAEAAVEEAALTIEGFSDLITKAKKFTPGRIEKLKGAVEALKGLLEEIDSVPQGTNPGVSPAGGQQFGASGIKVLTEKANGEPSDLVKAVTELANVVKGLAEGQKAVTEKVEAIEKARPASASLEAQGGTDTKVAKSALWSGIL